MKVFARFLILAAIVSGIVACIRFLGRGDLTGREAGLMSIVLTGLSILASWVVTEMYSASQHRKAIAEVQEFHRTNLRTYARKAAEKVTNLSNELARLSSYLQQELDYTEYHTVEEELQAKEERLESAIHIINTLKSVNDTSLSDWQGVIGDELDEQREERNEREQELRGVIERMELQLTEVADLRTRQQSTQEMRSEIQSLRRDLRLALSALSGVPVSLPRVPRPPSLVEVPCPSCGGQVKYRQKRKVTSIKATNCPSCGTRLVARYDEQRGHFLERRMAVSEKFSCPSCSAACQVDLDVVPSSTVSGNCAQCGADFIVVRTADGLRVRARGRTQTPPSPTEEVINLVRAKLPQQPWPTGIHKVVASELQISSQVVHLAIQELIRRGIFLLQAGGRLYQAIDCAEALEGRPSISREALADQ